jgi:hypothetical protein
MRYCSLFVVCHCDADAVNVELIELNIIGKFRGGIFRKNRVSYGSLNKMTVRFVRLFKRDTFDLKRKGL